MRRPLAAWTALVKADLNSLRRSWLLWGWVIVLALWEFVNLGTALLGSKIVPVPASLVLTRHLVPFLLLWSIAIIVLSAGSVSLETDIVADSILSRACTRTQYILAKLASRVSVILGIYALSSGIAGYCAWRYAASDVTWLTVVTGIGIVGMAVLLLVSFGVFLSVLLNNTTYSILGLFLIWYVAGTIFTFAGAEYLAPVSLQRNLPRILKDSRAPKVLRGSATPSSITIVFSKDVDAQKAETVDNYSIQCPADEKHVAETAAYDQADRTVLLGGLELPAGKTAKVIVSGITDAAGNDVDPSADFVKATVTGTGKKRGEETKGGSRLVEARAAAATLLDEGTAAGDGSAGAARKGAGTAGADTGAGAVPDRTAGSAADGDTAAGKDGPPTDASGTADPGAGKRGKTETTPDSGDDKRAAGKGTSGGPAPEVTQCTATTSSVKVFFKGDLEPKDAERPRNYVIESPVGKTHAARAAVYQRGAHAVVLSGLTLTPDDPVKVTVKNIKGANGKLISRRRNAATYSSVTTWKYALGFGIPALLFALGAVLAFSRRDL